MLPITVPLYIAARSEVGQEMPPVRLVLALGARLKYIFVNYKKCSVQSGAILA